MAARTQPNPVGGGDLHGVAAGSTGIAWAVGSTDNSSNPKTLIERWNGAAWKLVSSPASVGGSRYGVAAMSARDAWAVGFTGPNSFSGRAHIEHRNGITWRQVPSPHFAAISTLEGHDAGERDRPHGGRLAERAGRRAVAVRAMAVRRTVAGCH